MTEKNASASLIHLREGLNGSLPGWNGQKLMSSQGYDSNRIAPQDAKQAAVMLLLYPDEQGALHTIFIKRPQRDPRDKHAGQISFPGGQKEAGDIDMAATALRETQEELGIPSEHIEVLGALSTIYVFVSNFLVYPYVGYMAGPPQYVLQKSEVEYPIPWSLENLIQIKEPLRKDLRIRNMILKSIPYYDLNGDTLWGATAMITSEFLYLLKNSPRY